MEHKIAVRQFEDDFGRRRRFHYFLLVDGLVGPAGLSDVVEDWAQVNPSAANAGPLFAGASPAGR